MSKIFQIGFNRCGTTFLYKIFKNANVASVHWDRGKLGKSIYDNKTSGNKLLQGKYDKCSFYSDMETCFLYNNKLILYDPYITDFKTLDKQYPHSKFILNTRNINNWIKSRLHHVSRFAYLSSNDVEVMHDQKQSYIYNQCLIYNKEPSAIILNWKENWHKHHESVIKYFQNRPNDLLIFNIEKDDINKLCKFLPNIKFNTTINIDKNPSKINCYYH